MNISINKISCIISFYDILLKYKIYKRSKLYQKYNQIDINHYKMINFLQNNIRQQSDMSLYYDCLKVNYPSVPDKTIKEILLYYLNEYAKNNKINIGNINEFSVDILNKIKENIVLSIYSIEKHIKSIITKSNTNIISIEYYDDCNSYIQFLFDNIIPYNIKKLIYQKEKN